MGAVGAGLKKGFQATGRFAVKHKFISGAATGYVVGVGAGKATRYGDTYNQGRAEDRHPRGGYYG